MTRVEYPKMAEIMKSSSDIAIFLLVAMGLTMMSAQFDVPCDGTPPSEDLSNDFLVALTFDDSGCENKAGHENSNCCESGCQDCNLACCAGLALIAPTAQFVDPAPNLGGRLAATTSEVSWVDPDQLFHPPRA